MTTDEIAIETGIPMPPRRRTGGGRRRKYRFGEMQVGQSIFVACGMGNTLTTSAARHMRQTNTVFESRTMDGGMRIWRVR